MLRIRQICGQGMLEKYQMPADTQEELIQFIFENKHRLREISLRMVLKIADLWKMKPDGYQALATEHLHEAWGIDGFDHAYDTGADRGCDALDLGVGHCHGADMGLDRIRLMIPDVIMPLIGIVLISTIMVLMT